MTPHCIENGDIKNGDLAVLGWVKQFLRTLPSCLDCHEVCRRIAKQVPREFEHWRGKFNGGWDHSWLVFRHDPFVLIDPYPWACASGPLLLTTQAMSPWRFLYDGKPVLGE